jgi:hypothetical protein
MGNDENSIEAAMLVYSLRFVMLRDERRMGMVQGAVVGAAQHITIEKADLSVCPIEVNAV